MNASPASPHWQGLPSPPIVNVLRNDEDIEDVVALSGAAASSWLKGLSIPDDWQMITLPEGPEQVLARIAVHGPTSDDEWEAADTIEISGFSGWPAFYDLYRNVDSVLRGLGATGVSVRALPVPAHQWTAALRTSGTVLIGERRVWIQQSNYVAGSDRPNASRAIVHTIVVSAKSRERLSDSISELSANVYECFVDALTG